MTPSSPSAPQPDFPDIVARGPAFKRLLEQVAQIAPFDSTVLIEGESGTGKELLAQLIHRLSPRAARPLLAINCGALSPELLASTLFGHEKGAFTGAWRASAGYFEEVNAGTLFLDEIQDMSAKLQASLLRVLQERAFTRLGGTVARKTDFRLICSTNHSIAEEVERQRFRSDLYYRIKVVLLRVPPLRERTEDIEPLARHFLARFNRAFGKTPPCELSGPALQALLAHPWPGNVRELEHTLERAVLLNRGGVIHPAELELSAVQAATAAPGPLPFREARDEFERDYFSALMAQAGNCVAQASRLSGLARQNIYPYLRRHALLDKD